MRESELTGREQIRSAYVAKAKIEVEEADALIAAPPGSWEGPLVGTRIVFAVGSPAEGGVLDERVGDAVAKVADALGVAGAVFALSTRPATGVDPDAAVRRVRLLIEALDPPAVIALDPVAAEDLASAFDVQTLREDGPVRAFGRALGNAGDFAAALDDPQAKARAWSSMKGVAALAGLEPKGRLTTPPDMKAKE